jgi:methionyl-tRNA synthetase
VSRHILTAVAWPYANGPRHIGHVAGFGVPSDVFSRYQRLAGNKVLMVSGTDEHGTPILVQADKEGVSPRELADRYNRVIAEDLQQLGLAYDLFTRTTTRNHYAVAQQLFLRLHENGYSDALGSWLQSRTDWRPNVLKFSLNLVSDLKPRAISRDLDWGVPIPLPEWRDRPDKRLYVWFDAVIGYLSASIEWARRTGDADAWRPWWTDSSAESFYFMGKDNVTFHSVIWPSILLGYDGEGSHGGSPGELGRLELPTEVVSSEFLTMEGRKFSSSRSVVILVRDFLSRYSADSLRFYLSTSGPENQDTDFTWAEFVRRNNDELVAAWGNLVNRTLSFTAKNIGTIPESGELSDVDRQLLAATSGAFDMVGAHLERSRMKAGITEAVRVVAEANKYLSEQAPWKLRESDPQRMHTILHVALQAISDCNTVLSPFLPHSAQQVHEMLGRNGVLAPQPRLDDVDDLDGGPSYPVLTGDYALDARWESEPITAGVEVTPPVPLFAKLDTSVVDEELARMSAE